MSNTTRLFFALWPPAELLDGLQEIQRRQTNQGSAKAISRQRIHLTLLFLGQADLDLSRQAGERAAACSTPFTLQLDRFGFFARPRVVWITAEQPPQELFQLAEGLRREVRRVAQPFDKKDFSPHVTLYRQAKPPQYRGLEQPLVWRVEELALVRSSLQPQGPEYRSLGVWRLGASSAEPAKL